MRGHLSTFTIDFGFASGGEGSVARMTVPADWAHTGSRPIVQPSLCDTPDHDSEDALLENLTGAVTAVHIGTGFDVCVYAPAGTWGQYKMTAIGF